MIRTSIITADHSYNEWLVNLDICEQELDLLKSRLDGISEGSPDKALAEQIAGYADRIKRGHDNIQHLQHSISENIDELTHRSFQDGEWYIENTLGREYHSLREEVNREVRDIDKLKQEINQFAATRP